MNEIETLIKKASDAHDSHDAMRFSQAALNVANAKITEAETPTRTKTSPLPLSGEESPVPLNPGAKAHG